MLWGVDNVRERGRLFREREVVCCGALIVFREFKEFREFREFKEFKEFREGSYVMRTTLPNFPKFPKFPNNKKDCHEPDGSRNDV